MFAGNSLEVTMAGNDREKRTTTFWVVGGLGLLAVLVVIKGMVSPMPPTQPAPQVVDDPAAAPAFAGELASMGGQGQFTGLADPASTPQSLERAARAHCADQQFCSVYLWASEANQAKAMPMLDREVAARVFAYDLNRASGFERALHDCTRWPVAAGAPRDECL
jgi:hypothetical protein